ncbi:hypothetical protein D3C72_1825230 [compost metagenome]
MKQSRRDAAPAPSGELPSGTSPAGAVQAYDYEKRAGRLGLKRIAISRSRLLRFKSLFLRRSLAQNRCTLLRGMPLGMMQNA